MRNIIYLVLYYINETLLTSDADVRLSATEYVCVCVCVCVYIWSRLRFGWSRCGTDPEQVKYITRHRDKR